MTEQDIQKLIDRVAETRDLFTFDQFIRHWAAKSPNRAAIDSDDLQLTYAELEQATARVTSALLAMGLKKGDRIAWFGKNSGTYFTLFFGAARAGFVMTPVGWRNRKRPSSSTIPKPRCCSWATGLRPARTRWASAPA